MLLSSILVLVLGVLEELNPRDGCSGCSCFSGVLNICNIMHRQL